MKTLMGPLRLESLSMNKKICTSSIKYTSMKNFSYKTDILLHLAHKISSTLSPVHNLFISNTMMEYQLAFIS